MVEIDPAHSHGALLGDFLDRRQPPCSLGLSRGSSASNRGRLTATLEWLGDRAREIVVVEGSYLARWNRMALDGASESTACREADREAAIVRRRIESVLRESSRPERSRFLEWKTLAESREVRAGMAAMEDFAESNAAFESSVGREVHDYVRRTRGVSADALTEESRRLLRAYVLEEAAVLLDLQRRGYRVEIYHGPDLAMLAEITEGRFPGAPFSCADRTHVSLRLFQERDGTRVAEGLP